CCEVAPGVTPAFEAGVHSQPPNLWGDYTPLHEGMNPEGASEGFLLRLGTKLRLSAVSQYSADDWLPGFTQLVEVVRATADGDGIGNRRRDVLGMSLACQRQWLSLKHRCSKIQFKIFPPNRPAGDEEEILLDLLEIDNRKWLGVMGLVGEPRSDGREVGGDRRQAGEDRDLLGGGGGRQGEVGGWRGKVAMMFRRFVQTFDLNFRIDEFRFSKFASKGGIGGHAVSDQVGLHNTERWEGVTAGGVAGGADGNRKGGVWGFAELLDREGCTGWGMMPKGGWWGAGGLVFFLISN
ncbi:hypothetical protein BDK51DRAFT_33327, partial [Blyttiomyces helicus]